MTRNNPLVGGQYDSDARTLSNARNLSLAARFASQNNSGTFVDQQSEKLHSIMKDEIP